MASEYTFPLQHPTTAESISQWLLETIAKEVDLRVQYILGTVDINLIRVAPELLAACQAMEQHNKHDPDNPVYILPDVMSLVEKALTKWRGQ